MSLAAVACAHCGQANQWLADQPRPTHCRACRSSLADATPIELVEVHCPRCGPAGLQGMVEPALLDSGALRCPDCDGLLERKAFPRKITPSV